MKRLMVCSCCAFVVWTVWCALMVWIGAPFDGAVIRAIARMLALTGPAVYLLVRANDEHLDRLGVTTNWKKGVAVGLGVSVIWGAMHLGYTFTLPNSTHAWLNVIVLSPIAEELFFRRASIEFGLRHVGVVCALLISSSLFAAFHLPWWVLSGEKEVVDVFLGTGTMFVYGLVFGGLYVWTKSIWSCLIPHSANNFIACSIGN